MIDALVRRAFFRFELPIHYREGIPPVDGSMQKWKAKYLLAPLVELEDQPAFADVYAAWNEGYLFVAFDVPQRSGLLSCDPTSWWKQNGVRVCIDTRDTRDVKRATRFCHFFYMLPTGSGSDGKRPVVGFHRMSRAKEPPPSVDISKIKVAAQIDRHGYALEAAIPAACLNGWDPAEHPRIGFFYKVKDTYHGEQHLTVDDELGWNVDPSTWATAVLVR